MANWYYYSKTGEKVGPVSATSLKDLARQGLITKETKVENQNGRTAAAGQINGLTFAETKPPETATYGLNEGFDFPTLTSQAPTPPGHDPFGSVAPVAQHTASPAQGPVIAQQPLQFQVPTASLFCAACGNGQTTPVPCNN